MRMLEISSWRREWRAFDRIRCTPPEGEDVAEIVIHERVRPLTSLRALVDQRIGAGGATGPATQLATYEGELGAVIDFDAAGAHHTLGVIYGDDFQTIIDARTTRAGERDRIHGVTRELVVHLPLGLGQKRHRRFWYRPPAGWQGLVRGLVTDWFPLDHPRNPATIKVLPARPFNTMFQLDTFLRDDTFTNVALRDVTRTAVSFGGLKGTVACALSAEHAYVTAALEDQQYIYVLRLATTHSRLAADESIFQDVLKSCVPLQLPPADRAPALPAQTLDYWTT